MNDVASKLPTHDYNKMKTAKAELSWDQPQKSMFNNYVANFTLSFFLVLFSTSSITGIGKRPHPRHDQTEDNWKFSAIYKICPIASINLTCIWVFA